MIDKSKENLYNIIFSLFLGVLVVIIINNFFESPRIIEVYRKEAFDSLRSNNPSSHSNRDICESCKF